MTQLNPGARLPAEILDLLAHVTAPLGKASVTLQRQAEVARVVRCSATMLDIAVPADRDEVELPDGPVPARALVYDHEQLVGELLVWVRNGRLIGLEQAWYTETPPRAWPSPESVRVA